MTSDLSKTGILLLSHGSRLDQGKKVIEAYTQMYKEEFPEAIVEYGFMEMREPNIPQSINKLTNGNDLEKIIVVPVFVAHGLHTRRDIPKLLGNENDFDESDPADIMSIIMTTDIIITITTIMTMIMMMKKHLILMAK